MKIKFLNLYLSHPLDRIPLLVINSEKKNCLSLLAQNFHKKLHVISSKQNHILTNHLYTISLVVTVDDDNGVILSLITKPRPLSLLFHLNVWNTRVLSPNISIKAGISCPRVVPLL